MNDNFKQGSFTLPGEAGYEKLTLELAKKWGADVIRDSDGTKLSDEIVSAGYDIYSTLCVVREDNEWAKANMDKLQQNFLMSFPIVAESDNVTIDLLKGFFKEQFIITNTAEAISWWQVFDRTTGEEVSADNWSFDENTGTVTVKNVKKWHKYTVNFLVTRIWEEISMYNHITNNWGDKEHLMAIEPRYPETQEHILVMLRKWLEDHKETNVVRFTSMFYNFCWFWGDNPRMRFVYGDWGSYDFTVNPYTLKDFAEKKGYKMTSEDFVNKGYQNATHNAPTDRYKAWMDYINEFVVEFGAKLVELVHEYDKKAYVFYDDHWIGIEPYGERFAQFKFDGIIKCVFNAFEARKGAGVPGVKTHELRLHPYLFPTGLIGEPTFAPGGNPTLDCKRFWVNVRRALLRKPVDRIGFGGYLHLVEPFPDFMDYVEGLAQEFRMFKSFHADGEPYVAPAKVAVLTSWGKLRSWICSGHMHEHPEIELTQILEALAGMSVDVEFISFDDVVKNGVPNDVKVIINAGREGSAWSGGFNWENAEVIEKITEWVNNGGAFIGVGEPSSARYQSQFFQMSHVLGVDRELGNTICKSKYLYEKPQSHFITADVKGEIDFAVDVKNVYATSLETTVVTDEAGSIKIATNNFGSGKGVYLSGFKYSPENTRLLYRAICFGAGCEDKFDAFVTDNVYTECAYYKDAGKLVIINNSDDSQKTSVKDENGKVYSVSLDAHGIEIINVK